MKATLQFDLPEETVEHLDALHGWEWKLAYRELLEQLRAYEKHGHTFKNADECVEELRTIAHSLLDDRGLHLE